MSDRPEWMPNDDAIRACSAVDHVESANMKLYVVTATGALLHKTGLRAQIAVLEEVNDAADLFVASTADRDAEWVVTQKSLAIKIAALRKEIEQ